jgi:hypothetical protein
MALTRLLPLILRLALAAGAVTGSAPVDPPPDVAPAQKCDDCLGEPEGVVPAGPTCESTPASAPISRVSVACLPNKHTRLQLEAFSSPLNTMGSVLRMFVWSNGTGVAGLGGPGWVEVPAPKSSTITNTFIDIKVGGRVALSSMSQVCDAASTIYTQIGWQPPQFQCFTWGAVITYSPDLTGASAASTLSGFGLNTNVAVGSRVFALAATVVDGQTVTLAPVTAN